MLNFIISFTLVNQDIHLLITIRFEGVAYLQQGRSKAQLVTVVVLSDIIIFMYESNQKLHFLPAQDNKVMPYINGDYKIAVKFMVFMYVINRGG